MAMTISVADKARGIYAKADLTSRQVVRLNNYHMISIGLIVGEDITPQTLDRWLKTGIATRITHEQWNHSGCLSACTLRGAPACRW